MENVTFFVEGPDDKNFLDSYLNFLNADGSSAQIVAIGGWTKLSGQAVINQIVESTKVGRRNIIIFDADEDCIKRRGDILGVLRRWSIEDVPFFLFPNNQENGSLDTLLINIHNKDYSDVNICFDAYVGCLEGLNKGYSIPTTKEKIFAFIYALGEEPSVSKRHYNNEKLWTLSHKALNPLKDFLLNL